MATLSPDKNILSPQLPKRLRSEPISALAEGAEYSGLVASRCDFAGQAAGGVLFEQVVFRRTSFNGSTLTEPRLFDVRAEVTDFSGADWKKARFRRAEFIECRLLGIQLLEATLEDVVFTKCTLESAVFASAVFKAARFEACLLRGALFEEADLRGVVFHRCDLTHADLRGADLRGADLRGSVIDGMKVGPKEVQGAIIDPVQAVQVAGLLGLTVKPADEE
jgi:uncharacterized protein YjbI with pentapeptide repeats